MSEVFNCELNRDPFQLVYKIWKEKYSRIDCTIIFPNRRSCRNFKQKLLQCEDNFFLPKIISITDLFSCSIKETEIINVLISHFPKAEPTALFDLSQEVIDTIKELALNNIDFHTLLNCVPLHLQEYNHPIFNILKLFDKHITSCKTQINQQVINANNLIQNSTIIAVELGQANFCVKNFLKEVANSNNGCIVFSGLEAPINREFKMPLSKFLPNSNFKKLSEHTNDNYAELATFQNSLDETIGVALAIRKAISEMKTVLVVSQSQSFIQRLKNKLKQWNIIPDTSIGSTLSDTKEGKLLILVAQVFASQYDCNSLINLLKQKKELLKWIYDFEIFIRKKSIAPKSFFRCFSMYQSACKEKNFKPSTYQEKNIEPIENIVKNLQKFAIQNEQLPLRDWLENCYTVLNVIFGDIKNSLQFNELYKNLSNEFLLSADDFFKILKSQILTETVQRSTGYTNGVIITGAIEAQLLSADLVIITNANKESWSIQAQNETFLSKSIRHSLNIADNEQQSLFLSSIFERLLHQKNVLITRAKQDNDKKQIPHPLINKIPCATWLQDLTYHITHQCNPNNRQIIEPSKPQLIEFPKVLYVSHLIDLMRNPYAFYAKHILKLNSISMICENKNIKGNFIHKILEKFFTDNDFSKEHLQNIAEKIQQEYQLDTSDIGLIMFQLSDIFEFVLSNLKYKKYYAEVGGCYKLNTNNGLDIDIKCRADLIAVDEENNATIIDYKTGTPPNKNDEKYIQLPIEAIILNNKGFNNNFKELSNSYTKNLQYWQLNKDTEIKDVKIETKDKNTGEVVNLYDYTLNRIKEIFENLSVFEVNASANSKKYDKDYIQLSRYEEWRHAK